MFKEINKYKTYNPTLLTKIEKKKKKLKDG